MILLRQILYGLFVFFLSLTVKGQPSGDTCSSAQALCVGNVVHYNNIGATVEKCPGCPDGNLPADVFCYEVNNSVWYSFTTNAAGGNATVSFSNIACLTGGGRDSQIEATVFTAPNACTPPYGIVQCTSTFSTPQTITLTGLLPNTTYYVHVDGDNAGAGVTAPAECEFDLEVNGPAVEPQFNTTITNASCAGNDGAITVNSVTGAAAPLTYSLDGGPFQASSSFTNLAAGTHTLIVNTGTGCTYSTAIDVPLAGGPQDGVPVVTNANCSASDGSINITGVTGGTGPYTYSLNGGAPQASSTFAGLNSGMYNVTVTDVAGCSFTYENINVPTNGSYTSVVFNIVQPTCATPTGTLTITPIGGSAPYSYSLNGGPPQPSNIFTGLAPGTYLVLIFDNAGCLYSNSQIIITPPQDNLTPTISISPNSVSICQGENITFNAFYSNGGTTPVLQWQVNGVNAGTGASTFPTTTLNNGDVVTCTLTSNDPCAIDPVATSNSVNVTVTPQVNPTVVINAASTQVCQGEMASFTAVVDDCPNDGTYYWYVNGVLRDSTSGQNFSAPMNTTTEVICTFRCNVPCANEAVSNSVQINVTQVMADAGPNQVIGKGETAQLQGDGLGTPVWTPPGTLDNPASLTPIATPEQTTVYTLTVVNDGCVAIDEVTIVVTDLIVFPNTFTPNGDGVNDVWHIRNIEKFPSCKVTIYDRWGQKVFNSTGYTNDNAWDGTYLNKVLPAAAYYYIIELNAANSKEADTYYGWLSIIY